MSDATPGSNVASPLPSQGQASNEGGLSDISKVNGFHTHDYIEMSDIGDSSKAEKPKQKEKGASYPLPSAQEVETTLPPWQPTNPPLGLVTERLIKTQYWELQHLVTQRLPYTAPRDRPQAVIQYAQTARQSTLKLLALLRWKSAVDVGPGLLALPTTHPKGFPVTNGYGGVYGDDQTPSIAELNKGRLRDIARVTTLMEYYNDHFKQNIVHLENVRRQVESLRIRNADLLSAIDVHATGTYTRLPSSLTDFIPPPPLANEDIIPVLNKLDTRLRYRLRALDYVPPDLLVERIQNGKAFFRHRYGAWSCSMTVLGFGLGSPGPVDSWCFLNVDFGIGMTRDEKLEGDGDDLKDLVESKVTTELRDEVIRMAALVLLPVTPIDAGKATEGTVMGNVQNGGKVDAPLARVCNLLQTISLTYQIELLHNQALRLSAFAWRDTLRVEMAKDRKSLRVDYWVRPRAVTQTTSGSASAAQPPLVGGSIHFNIVAKAPTAQDRLEAEIEELANVGFVPSDTVKRTAIRVSWDVTDGNWLGVVLPKGMEGLSMEVDPAHLDVEHHIIRVTRLHAERLTRALASAIVTNSRAVTVFEHNGDVSLAESSLPTEPPAALLIPLPSSSNAAAKLEVCVSYRTGSVEMREVGLEAASAARKVRLEQAVATVNSQPSKMLEVVWRLTAGIIMDKLFSQFLQLGWNPLRRIGLRVSELTKAGLQSSAALYVQLPTSPLHYFVATMDKALFRFGLLQLRFIAAESGVGTRLAVGDLGWLDLDKIIGNCRMTPSLRLGKRKRFGTSKTGVSINSSHFSLASSDLRDLYAYCNARVAHLKVEQQFKDRGIHYTLVFPPVPPAPVAEAGETKASELMHLIPSFCVNAKDLLKDGRAVDVALPNVAMQIRGWWKAGPCHVITSVKLLHQPPLRTTAGTPAEGGPSTLQSENISFDPSTSVVSFLTDDIDRCLVTFLEQWERLSKVIVVAGEVNRVNKDARFTDVKMLSFDLKTTSFTYSPGYATSITYTPASDSYDASFFCTDHVSGIDPDRHNPHDACAALWSDRLNELASLPDAAGLTCSRFVGLLRYSLPLLTELEHMASSSAAQPRSVMRSVANYRLVWDASKTRRHAIDIFLQPVTGRYLIHDATAPIHVPFVDTSCGILTPLEGIDKVLTTAFEIVRDARNGETWSLSCPPLIKLDNAATLLSHADFIVDTLRSVINGVNSSLRT